MDTDHFFIAHFQVYDIWPFSLADDVVLITGGAGGLGREIALEFARKGAIIVLWDINDEEMTKVTEMIVKENEGTKVYAYHVDLR